MNSSPDSLAKLQKDQLANYRKLCKELAVDKDVFVAFLSSLNLFKVDADSKDGLEKSLQIARKTSQRWTDFIEVETHPLNDLIIENEKKLKLLKTQQKSK